MLIRSLTLMRANFRTLWIGVAVGSIGVAAAAEHDATVRYACAGDLSFEVESVVAGDLDALILRFPSGRGDGRTVRQTLARLPGSNGQVYTNGATTFRAKDDWATLNATEGPGNRALELRDCARWP